MKIYKFNKILLVLTFSFAFFFSFQTLEAQNSIRDYVCIVRQSFHPDVISYLEKIKDFYKKRGQDDVVKSLDTFMKGSFGSGFVYVDATGKNYILTNNHVIDKSYKISVEFEKAVNGEIEKTVYNNIEIIAIDEDVDVAVLAFPKDKQPFRSGLPFAEKNLSDGEEVFSAGFPGTIGEAIWQFGNGRVSNALVRLPAIDENDKAVGPYIQHNAPIDPGNSGGPLLVPSAAAPGYAVTGINTLSIRNRQAANYAVPAAQVKKFLASAFSASSDAALKAKLDARLENFVAGLSAPKALYPHIAAYLSYEYVAPLAEFSISEVYEKANYDAKNDIFSQSFLTGMNYAAGWVSEMELRKNQKTGALHPELGAVTKNSNGTYKAEIKFPGRIVDTTWALEYGVWRITSFSNLADAKALFAEKQTKAAEEQKLKTDYTVAFFAGWAKMGDAGSTLDASINFSNKKNTFAGIHLLYNKAYTIVEANAGVKFSIRAGVLAFIPFLNVGAGAAFHDSASEFSTSKFSLGVSGSAGLMLTTRYTKGLFLKGAYQFNGYGLLLKSSQLPDVRHTGSIGIGYMF